MCKALPDQDSLLRECDPLALKPDLPEVDVFPQDVLDGAFIDGLDCLHDRAGRLSLLVTFDNLDLVSGRYLRIRDD